MSSKNPLGRARGLGSAKSGTRHWWLERMVAVAIFLLMIWFLASLLFLPDLDYRTVTEWLRVPLAAVPMALLILSVFWHGQMGMKVVIEDYVHGEGTKLFSLLILNFLSIAGGALALFALLKIALGGDAASG